MAAHPHTKPVAARISIVKEFLGTLAQKIPAERIEGLVAELDLADDRRAAAALKARFAALGIPLKHMHALQLAARLAGRRGMNQQLPLLASASAAFELVVFTGHRDHDLKAERSDELERLLVDAITTHAEANRPALFLMRAGLGELMIHRSAGADLKFLAIFKWHGLFAEPNVRSLCERMRRGVEESGHGFCDGYLGAIESASHPGEWQIAAMEESIPLGLGNELWLFDRIERTARGEMPRAGGWPENGVDIVAAARSFSLSLRTRPTIAAKVGWQQRTLFPPEIDHLLHRQRRLSKTLQSPIAKSAWAAQAVGTTPRLPEDIPMEWSALETLRATAGISPEDLESQSDGAYQAHGARAGFVPLTSFVAIASALVLADFNKLVAGPTWPRARPIVEPDELQMLLNVADDAKVWFGKGFDASARQTINEAAAELGGSRRLLQVQRAGVVKPDLDEIVFAGDAMDFLGVMDELGVEVRATLTPMFQRVDGVLLPGVGTRCDIIVRPYESTRQ